MNSDSYSPLLDSPFLRPEVAFALLWSLGVLLAQIHLFEEQSEWSVAAWVVVASVPLGLWAGAELGRRLVSFSRNPSTAPVLVVPEPGRRLRLLLVGALAIGSAEAARQFAIAGFVPLLAANIDQARTTLPGGPSTALLNGLVIAVIGGLTAHSRLFSRAALPEVLIACAALVVIASFGGRGPLLLPLITSFLARWAMFGLPRRSVVLSSGLVLAALVSLLFFVRTAQPPTDNFERELYVEVVAETPPVLRPAVPLHLVIALNFEALAQIVDHFPAQRDWGGGRYNAMAVEFVVPTALNVADVSREISPPWIVSTVAGPLWADGGLLVVVVGLVVIGGIAGAGHELARTRRHVRYILLYSLVLYMTLFGVYQNLYTQYIDWVALMPLLVLVGAVAARPEHPPGVTGRFVDAFEAFRRPRRVPGPQGNGVT